MSVLARILHTCLINLTLTVLGWANYNLIVFGFDHHLRRQLRSRT
jgi:hypothetical protein